MLVFFIASFGVLRKMECAESNCLLVYEKGPFRFDEQYLNLFHQEYRNDRPRIVQGNWCCWLRNTGLLPKRRYFSFAVSPPSSCRRCPQGGNGEMSHRGHFDRVVHAPRIGMDRTVLFIKAPRLDCRRCERDCTLCCHTSFQEAITQRASRGWLWIYGR